MSVTADDERIEAVIQAELEEGRTYLERADLDGTHIAMHRHPRTDVMLFEFGGQYAALPDRKVYATVEVDPARLGWRLEATLWEYPETDWTDREVAGLGGARVESPESAAQQGRIQATAAWVAVRDYVLKGGKVEDAG